MLSLSDCRKYIQTDDVYLLASCFMMFMPRTILRLLQYLLLSLGLTNSLKRYLVVTTQNPNFDRIYFIPIQTKLKEALIQLCKSAFVAIVCVVIDVFISKSAMHALTNFTFTFIVCALYQYWDVPRNVEKKEISKEFHLDIGYGAALAYYHNYLRNFFPLKFGERVQLFQTKHHVNVLNKLYILLPKSCRVLQYIDETSCVEKCTEPVAIERCTELPPFQIDFAGIKGRKYNATVYQIRKTGKESGIRCVIEYAQPLRELYHLKLKKRISENEMNQQRDVFKDALINFMNDENNSNKYCEILEYDDDCTDLHNVLFEIFAPLI